MTDPDDNPSGDTESTASEPAAASQLMEKDHPIVRLTRWQTVMSVVSIFIALIALYAALGESAAVRQQTAASVWPILQFTVQDSDDGSDASIAFRLTNAGVGPARVRSFRLRIEGKAVTTWDGVLTALQGEDSSAVQRDFIRSRVIRADETVTLFSTADADLARRLLGAVVHPQSLVSYCYCSIFDDCWLVADSAEQTGLPEAVTACPDFGNEAFTD